MSNQIRVIVVDDHPLFRSGVISALELDDQIHVVADCGSASEAIYLVKTHQPDVVLLDISLSDGSGIAVAAAVSSSASRAKILMLSVSNDGNDVRDAIKEGANGYVLKGVNAAELIESVKTVVSGGPVISAALSFELISSIGRQGQAKEVALLTQKEREILELVASGKSNRKISDLLEITEKTVKYHVYNAFKKLNVRNRVQASQALGEQDRTGLRKK